MNEKTEIGYIIVDPEIPLAGDWDTPIKITRAEHKEDGADDADMQRQKRVLPPATQ